MDTIETAIKKGQNISRFEELNYQTWDDFNKQAKNKKIILWGLGKLLFLIELRFNSDYYISYAIDSDPHKTGLRLKDYIDLGKYDKNEIIVSNKEILNYINDNEYVILINSILHYDEIAEVLTKKGFQNYYVSLIMEANQRLNNINANNCFSDVLDLCLTRDIQENKILFSNIGINADLGHNKYICEELLKIRNDLDIVWIVNKIDFLVPIGIRTVYKCDVPQYLNEMETAKIVVFDYCLDSFIKKRENQIYINVKHWASVTLKSFGIELAKHRKKDSEVEILKENGKNTDYIIGGGEFDETTCRKSFAFNGKFLHFGSPRSDVLFNGESAKKRVANYYSLNSADRYLLFAPTFRIIDNKQTNIIDIDFSLLHRTLKISFGGEWKIILRLHPNVSSESKIIKKSEYIIDASDYPDSQELVAISDIMITDYSSIMFESAFVKKPVFLFAPDRKEYIDRERGLLIDYDTLPFPIAETNEQLAEQIIGFDQKKYEAELAKFMKKYDVHEDGHASERAAQFISELIDGKV